MRFFNFKNKTGYCSIISILIFFSLFSYSHAKDTDIYEVNIKQNAYMLMDNSGSMDFGVYEHTIDYGEMFDYLFTMVDGGTGTYIHDTVNNSDVFYQSHQPKNKIFLWQGKIGVTTKVVDGKTIAFTGDASDPDYLWYSNTLVDTHTVIDESGNLAHDGSASAQRLTTDADGNILFDGVKLPLGQDIKLHDFSSLYDGTIVDNGFGGLLNAPGYYFSGYEGVTAGSLNTAENGDSNIFFFVTGNWVNMQAMYNLHYTTNNPNPTGASTGDSAWKFELFPISESGWSIIEYNLDYPEGDGVKYENNLKEKDTERTITHPGAKQIQIHFSEFDVEGDKNAATFKYDYVVLRDSAGAAVQYYDNDNKPTSGDGWSVTVYDDTVNIALATDYSVLGTGYVIDKIRVTYHLDSYLMQNRLDVAKDAMLYALDAFKGKINWGFATFKYSGTSGDGATLHHALNPTLSDDANSASIKTHVQNLTPMYGTPLGEALQDVFDDGYYGKKNSLEKLMCRKNYIISVSDGYPSNDEDWSRIGGVTITDSDGDGWTADPYQYSSPPLNYYDDVASWIYNHSWRTKAVVSDPANSYENVITHHVSFGMFHPLLQEAAGDSGGEYIAAYNKAQLVAALHSLGMMISEAVSFTSPVVSVDSENKIQSGDDLYLGLFLPQDNRSWVGNIKKFKFGDGTAARPDKWMLYDASNNEVIDADGNFFDNTDGFFGDENDANDSDNYGASDVTEDGVGELVAETVKSNFLSGSTDKYWSRPIYTYNSTSNSLVHFSHSNITATDLNVADDTERDKVINYTHGYTFEANADKTPVGPRDWALGAVLHSQPVIISYYDSTDYSVLTKRYIAICANDGMLHVYDDSDGKEVFSFIPEDLLTKLKLIPLEPFVDTADGEITLYYRDKQPKYLIFGERRGGGYYWCLDISDQNALNWTVKWKYTNSEIYQSWSKPEIASFPTAINSTTGKITFKDAVIITGGYDPEEDNYPEPFDDLDNNGSPYKAAGGIDTGEWSKNNSLHDVNGNSSYDLYNPGANDYGRGIFIFDIDNPSNVISDSTGNQILPFSVQYGASDDTSGASQTLTSMQYCFPASPSVILKNYVNSYTDASGNTVSARITNLFRSLYAVDIYANVYKVFYDFEVGLASGSYSITKNDWVVKKIFSANPGSLNSSGTFGSSSNLSDTGRKAFYPPAVSLGGSAKYFDAGNFKHGDVYFTGLDEIASIFFGTGDREHPQYTMIRNRFYSVYDDTSVKAYDKSTSAEVAVSGAPYYENDLLNLSCDELDVNTTLTGINKSDLEKALTDDVTFDDSGTLKLEKAVDEDDAKGWYIILEDQGDSVNCSHCTYPAGYQSADIHKGEKILSKPALFAEILYFTSYKPSISDPCNPKGDGFSYALNYMDGTSAYNYNTLNDQVDETKYDVSDRYLKISNIFGLPSSFAVVVRDGEEGAMSMMGGKIVGPGEDGFKIKGAPAGIEFYYWRQKNLQ